MKQEIVDKELKKNVAAIRVSNAVGLMARKAWNVLLVNAYHDLLDKEEHELPISVLCDVTGCNSRNYNRLRKALQELQKTLVEWDLGKGATINGGWCPDWVSMQMLGRVYIKNGSVYYTYPHGMPKYLHNPTVYQKISISQQRKFKTGYSLALWENCLRYINVGSTGFSDIYEWRELLGATAKTYDKFFLFNSKVLKPSISEVNKVSNIVVTLKTKRKGRKVISLGFDVEEKKATDLLSGDRLSKLESSSEFEEIVSYGIHKVKAIKWLDKYGSEYIRDKLNFVKSQVQSGKIKSSTSGFLVRSIEDDYRSEEDIRKGIEREKIRKQKEAEYQRRLEQQRKKLEEDFIKQAKEGYINSLSDQQRADLLEETREAYQDNPAILNMIKDINSPIVEGYLTPKIPDLEKRKEAYIKKNLKRK